MSKFYFNNVQKSQSEKKGKCGAKLLSGSLSASFMRWLLKIYIGLSVLLSSFVRAVFGKPPSLRTAATPPYAPSSSSSKSSCSRRQENRSTRSRCFFLSLSLFFKVLSLARQWAYLSRKWCAQICRSSRDQSAEDRSIHPTRCHAGGAHFCPVALSPRVTWLRFLHEHFFYHHIGIKSHNAQWHKWRNTLGGAMKSVGEEGWVTDGVVE